MTTPEYRTFTVESTGDGPSSVASGRLPDPVQTFTVGTVAPDLSNIQAYPTYPADDDEAVHGWFGLTYSNYLVLPRTLMQSMPGLWQGRMVRLLEEIRDAYAHIPQAASYQVQAGRWAYPSDLSAEELKALGFTRPDDRSDDDSDPDLADTWYGPDGEEHDGHTASIFVAGEDPIPHYNRGRTHIEPADPEAMREAASRLLTAANEAEAGR